jgi:carboxyl-terminal processing protease
MEGVVERRKKGMSKKEREEIVWWSGLAGLVLLGALVGGILGEEPRSTVESQEENPLIDEYEWLARKIDTRYPVPPDWDRLGRGAIRGMLYALDPHSNFFDRREFSEMQNEQNSKFYGIGVTVNQRNQRLYVIGVERGLPGDLAGLRYGDAILAVDGQSTELWTQSTLLAKVRGERGTEVELTVERAGSEAPLTVRIERDEVPYPSVRNAFFLREGIGYLGLTGGFNLETTRELHAAIAELKQEGMEALVLDLRRNPGGLLKQAVQVAETFLGQGTEIVAVRGREGRRVPQIYRSENTDPETFPLVLLIDRETASASEIVAGALQDHGRARIIGEESFGKGLVQNVFRLRGGTGLTLTTARYYTPSGRSIQREYAGSLPGSNRWREQVDLPTARFSFRLPFAPGPGVRRDTSRSVDGSAAVPPGGIQPDWVIPKETQSLALRDLCFEFARRLTSGYYSELAQYRVKRSEFDPSFQGSEFALSERVLWQFRQFVRERPNLSLPPAEIDAHLPYIRSRIRGEVIAAAYGMAAAEQYWMENDSVAQYAVQLLQRVRRQQALPQSQPRSRATGSSTRSNVQAVEERQKE